MYTTNLTYFKPPLIEPLTTKIAKRKLNILLKQIPRHIVALLSDGRSYPVHEITRYAYHQCSGHMVIDQPQISLHLGMMRRYNLVTSVRNGKSISYSLDMKEMALVAKVSRRLSRMVDDKVVTPKRFELINS